MIYIYILLNTQNKNINFNVLKSAIYETAKHRNTIDIIKEWEKVINQPKDNDIIKRQW